MRPEYVEVMWKMLQQETPDDYVIGTGEAHSVEEFVDEAFEYVNLDRHKHVVIEPGIFPANRSPGTQGRYSQSQRRS